MTSDDLREKLSLYLDGELEPTEQELLRRRIETDDDVRDAYERMRTTSSAMRKFFAAERPEPDEESERVGVDRIARASSAALSRKNLPLTKRNLWLPILLLLVGICGVMILGRYVWRSDPRSDELAADAREALDRQYLEFRPRLGGFRAQLLQSLVKRFPGALGDGIETLADGRFRTGPEGRFHLQIPIPDGMGSLRNLHAGFDGVNSWSYADGDRRVVRHERPVLGELLQPLRDLSRLLAREGDDAAQLDLLGKVTGDTPSGDAWWKMRVRGAAITDRMTLWFDEDRRLKRVSIVGLELDVTERPGLGPEAFMIATWAPGVPIEDESP